LVGFATAERNRRNGLGSTDRQESGNGVGKLRTAGEGVLSRGRSHRPITVVELPPETAGSVLKEVLAPRLASPLRGFVLRRTFPSQPTPLADFIAAARSDPVFEIVPARTV